MWRKSRFFPGRFRTSIPLFRKIPILGHLFMIGVIFFVLLWAPLYLIILLIGSIGRPRFNKGEAESLLSQEIDRLKKLSYEELSKLAKGVVEAKDVKGCSGKGYGIEATGIWDESCGEGGKLRVSVLIDDGGLSACWPLSRDFVIAPDGSIVKV